jgi:hypothetical protein
MPFRDTILRHSYYRVDDTCVVPIDAGCEDVVFAGARPGDDSREPPCPRNSVAVGHFRDIGGSSLTQEGCLLSPHQPGAAHRSRHLVTGLESLP